MSELFADPAIARRYLRSHSEALLFYGEQCLPRRYVLDPATGFPVIMAPGEVLGEEDYTFFVPEDSDDSLQLMVEPVELDATCDACADRYRIYHGKPSEVHLLRLDVLAAKFRGQMFEAKDVAAGNPLGCEPALCKLANQDPARLAALCGRIFPVFTGTTVQPPLAVGVDPEGVDLKARFGIIRVEFPKRAANAEEARAALLDLLTQDSST